MIYFTFENQKYRSQKGIISKGRGSKIIQGPETTTI